MIEGRELSRNEIERLWAIDRSEVIEAVYLGTSFKLLLACEGGMELLVRQPAKCAFS